MAVEKILATVIAGSYPPIEELDAITLAPHPKEPTSMWTIRWAGPKGGVLYANQSGSELMPTYPH